MKIRLFRASAPVRALALGMTAALGVAGAFAQTTTGTNGSAQNGGGAPPDRQPAFSLGRAPTMATGAGCPMPASLNPNATAPTAAPRAPTGTPAGGATAGGNGLNQAMAALNGGGFAVPGAAGGASGANACSIEEPAPVGEMTCDPRPAPAQVTEWKLLNTRVEQEVASCRQQLDQIPRLQACFRSEFKAVMDDINRKQAAFLAGHKILMEQTLQMSKELEDRKQQKDYITKKLDGEGGKIGLRQAKNDIQAALDSLNAPSSGGGKDGQAAPVASIAGMKEAQIALSNTKKRLVEFKESRKMALVRSCLSGPGIPTKAGESCFSCGNGCAPDLGTYLECRYKEERIKATGGTVYNYNQGAAAQAAGTLKRMYEDLLKDLPDDASVPAGGTDAEKAYIARKDGGSTIRTAKQLEEKWGAKFASYNNAGINVRGFIFNQVSLCLNGDKKLGIDGAVQKVTQEEQEKTSTLGLLQEDIAAKERLISSTIDDSLKKYRTAFSRAYKSVTGRELDYNQYKGMLNDCDGAKPEIAAQCMESMRDSYEKLLTGDALANGGSLPLDIPAQVQATAIPGRCSSVQDCLDTYEAILDKGFTMPNGQHSPGLNVDIPRRDNERKNFVEKANKAMEDEVRKYAQGLQNASMWLQARLDEIGGKLGIALGDKKIPTDGGQFEPNSAENLAGLYKVPKNVAGLIASFMQPAPPDIANLSGGDINKAIAEQRKDADKKSGTLTASKSKILTFAQACNVKDLRQALDPVSTADLQCTLEQFCQGGSDPLASLVSSIQSIPGGNSLNPGSISNLQKGAVCETPKPVHPGTLANYSALGASPTDDSTSFACPNPVTPVAGAPAPPRSFATEPNSCNSYRSALASYDRKMEELKKSGSECKRVYGALQKRVGEIRAIAGGDSSGFGGN